MKNNVCTNESYIKSNYKKEVLFESKGNEMALSEFLDLVAGDDEITNSMKFENVGAKIHKEICRLI